MPPQQIAVVGSVNLDLVAQVHRLPEPGESLAATGLERIPGGKGANQALAAQRLGAQVRLIATVGKDPAADEALALLRAGGVDLDRVQLSGTTTGLALITVDQQGETTIVVAAGANAELTVQPSDVRGAAAVLTVLEVPDSAVAAAARHADGFVALNAAPARPIDPRVQRRADLIVVNRAEFAAIPSLRTARCVAVTHGPAGALLLRHGFESARAAPPRVQALDGTAAGDAFAAALVMGLLAGQDDTAALRYACTAGAVAATRRGAQPSLPTAAEVEELLRS